MCGIAGHININNNNNILSSSDLEDMINSMIHRGPDDDGFYIDDSVQIGMRRLSIIDTHNGSQPIISNDNSIVVIMNGEIFNYKTLRSDLVKEGYSFKTHSDTEVLLNLYIKYGKDCITYLDGMFAFCIYDKNKKTVWIARDRVGIKPLFYSISGSSIVFGSTLDSISKSKLIKLKLCQESIDCYLFLSYIPTPKTIYEDIFKLEPGHEINIDFNQILINKYWDINSFISNQAKDKTEEIDPTLKNLLDESINKHSVSDQPVGTFLSGGLDSSLITYKYNDISSNFSCYTAEFKNKDQSDSIYASKIAKTLNLNHIKVDMDKIDYLKNLDELITYMDEPVYDSSILPTYLLSKSAKKSGISVLLAGNGADEVFGGYKRHYAQFTYYLRGKLSFVHKSILEIFSKIFNLNIHKILQLKFKYIGYAIVYSGNNLKILSNLSNNKLKKIENSLKNYFTSKIKSNSLSFKNRMKLIDFNCYLLDNGLSILDKCTMAASIEGRVPYLDHKLIQHTFKNDNVGNNSENYQNSKKFLRGLLNKSKISYITDRNKLGFNMPINNIISNKDNIEHIKLTLIATKPILEKHIDYPLMYKMVTENKSENAENIVSIYVLSKWIKNREKKCYL